MSAKLAWSLAGLFLIVTVAAVAAPDDVPKAAVVKKEVPKKAKPGHHEKATAKHGAEKKGPAEEPAPEAPAPKKTETPAPAKTPAVKAPAEAAKPPAETKTGEEKPAPAEAKGDDAKEDAPAEGDDAEKDKADETAAAGETTEETKAPDPKPAPPKDQFKVVEIWPGAVVQAFVTTAPQPFRDLDKLLVDNRFAPDAVDEATTIQRPPASGTEYAVITVNVQKTRSIGKHDYQLRAGTTTCPCLALSTEGVPFDPRTTEFKRTGDQSEVQLIFEVPTGSTEAILASALAQTLPQKEGTLYFTLPKTAPDPAAAAAPAEESAGGDAAAPAADAGAKAPEGKDAPAKDAPAKAAPAKDAPAKDAPKAAAAPAK